MGVGGGPGVVVVVLTCGTGACTCTGTGCPTRHPTRHCTRCRTRTRRRDQTRARTIVIPIFLTPLEKTIIEALHAHAGDDTGHEVAGGGDDSLFSSVSVLFITTK